MAPERSNDWNDHAASLAAAMGEPDPDLIRLIIESIREDAGDPISASARQRAIELQGELPRRPTWLETFDQLSSRILEPLFDDGPALASGLRGDDLRQCTLGVDDLRLDLEIETSIGRKDARGRVMALLRGQIDAEFELGDAVEVVVLQSNPDRMIEVLETDETGRFDIELPEGRYDLVFRLQDGATLVGTVDVP
ncbi:MAG: hypothetical protein VX672_09035 [Planctomycetota bacterium]|nr:hypothetical protein [Planctomycetota bacterium]